MGRRSMAPLVPRYNHLDCGLNQRSPSLPQRRGSRTEALPVHASLL
jgi:hypothetical protein